MKQKIWTILPLALFIIVVFFLWRGLHLNPHQLPSALIGKPIPAFKLPAEGAQQSSLTNQTLLGHVSLVNVWATWCAECRLEHPAIMDIAMQNILPIYGINYKDGRVNADPWLKQFGNPYTQVAFDDNGAVAINWGVYGTPETFIIDKKGVIQYKVIGPVTLQEWNKNMLPLIKKLQSEQA